MNRALADFFEQPDADYRIFLRHNPYRGISGSALRQSFVAGWNEQTVDSVERLESFIDHELIHEWVYLEGSYDETVWFNEGIADYYGIVLPHRHGLQTEADYLSRVNLSARQCFASPYHGQPLSRVSDQYWTDFRAQQVPYGRGMFYFAELDAELRQRGRTACCPTTWSGVSAPPSWPATRWTSSIGKAGSRTSPRPSPVPA